VKKKRNAATEPLMVGGRTPVSAWLLKAAQILRRCGIWRAVEEFRQGLDVADVVVLRLPHEVAHAHVFDYAPAQRADGLLAHRGLLS